VALLCLPRTNPELYRSVTLPMPRWLQVAAALLSVVSMGALIVLLMRDRETVLLLAAWSAIGALLYAVTALRNRRRRTYS